MPTSPAAPTWARPPRDDRAPRRLARPGLPPDVRAAAAHRAGRRRLADRPAGAPLSRRLQQRHVARALPSGGDRGDLPAGADAGDQYALSPRLDSRTGRAPARERAGDRAGPPDVDLHGQRGQRPRLSHCEGPHRWHRRDRDRHRVSRHHRHRLEILAVAGRDRRSRRACAPGSGAAPVSRRGRRPFRALHARRRGGDRRPAAPWHQAGRADRRFAVHQRRHPPGTGKAS